MFVFDRKRIVLLSTQLKVGIRIGEGNFYGLSDQIVPIEWESGLELGLT